MSITKLSYNQTNIVAGGYLQQDTEHAMGFLMETIGDGYPFFKDREANQCINVATTKYGITLCIPVRKPLLCSYELWGRLHDLAEEMPRC